MYPCSKDVLNFLAQWPIRNCPQRTTAYKWQKLASSCRFCRLLWSSVYGCSI